MSYIKVAKKYADDVLKGKIPACRYVKLACSRFKIDLKRKDIYLSADAERWCKFLEKLPHVKGEWAATGQTLSLSEYQIFCTVNIFGWKWKDTDVRRFHDVYIEVPRKNGKTFWVAGIGLGMLIIDGEFGAEVYCGATTEKQAFEVFNPAKLICQREPDLREIFGISVHAKTIVVAGNGSKFEPIIGDPGDGASPSCAITDEFHEHKDSQQVDTMRTGMGARRQPLGIKITTAGADMGGPCYETRADVIKILEGTFEDDTVFGIIYTIDDDDEWDTIEAQQKANPNYGISVNPEYLKAQLSQARRSARTQVAYKTKHLNQWVGAKSAWMNMLAFQACRKNISLEHFKGERCIIGIDLASRSDLACMAITFLPTETVPKHTTFLKHYLPEETILDNDKYKAWHAEGWITSTPGNVIDFGYIEDDLISLRSDYEILEVPYDPFQATQFSIRMLEEGFPMLEVGATVKNFSEPMKELEALILQKSWQTNFDPVLLWMFGNVVAKMDKKDNIFPNKEFPQNKIDGVVATIMTINRAMLREDEGTFDDFLHNPVVV